MSDLGAWLDKLPLRKSGKDYIGSCPVCGGNDRFHLQDVGDRVVVGCRGCLDGRPPAQRAEAYKLIVAATFGEGVRQQIRPQDWKARVERERQAHASAQEAARTAEKMLRKAEIRRHPYLARKGFESKRWLAIKALTFDREERWDLFVPIRDSENRMVSAQTIADDGDKRFISGSRVAGGSFTIGPRNIQRFVVEGFATALSIEAALQTIMPRNFAVVIAFSAGNIPKVARKPDIVLVDNDEKQVGAEAGERTGLRWHQPPCVGDFNDLHQERGMEAVISELQPLIRR